MIQGQLRADGIVVARFEADFTKQAGLDLKTEIKLVDTKSGRTVATAMVVSWTPEVLAKMDELVKMMELAIGKVLFTAAPTAEATDPARPGLQVPNQPGGLGEFLGGEEAPSV